MRRAGAVPGAGAGGRAPAKPRALTPTRPRVRVPALSVLAPGCVRRRWCSRTPSVNRARAPRAPTKCTGIFPEFCFPCADGWSRSRSRPLSLPVRVPGKKLPDSKLHSTNDVKNVATTFFVFCEFTTVFARKSFSRPRPDFTPQTVLIHLKKLLME